MRMSIRMYVVFQDLYNLFCNNFYNKISYKLRKGWGRFNFEGTMYTDDKPIQFLKHLEPSKYLVVIFLGGNNSTSIPILHYARKASLSIGCDVLSLRYPGKLNFKDNEIYDAIVEACFNIISKVNYEAYEKIVFISKSIGNLIAIDVERKHLGISLTHVFYTPVERLVEKVHSQECLIFTGANDKHIKCESVELMKGFRNTEVHQFPKAVHSLEVNEDVDESLKILKRATEILLKYLEKTLNK
jgi:hypothetical protein